MTQATQSASATPGEVESSSAAQAGVDLTNLPAPIASATAPAKVADDPNAKLTINLHQLRRSGKLMTATFSFQVQSTSTDTQSLYSYLDAVWWPFLVDTTNLKRYDVIVGGGSRAMTDVSLANFAPGQTLYAYAMFAAPPSSVTAVDVQMLAQTPTATGVPIT